MRCWARLTAHASNWTHRRGITDAAASVTLRPAAKAPLVTAIQGCRGSAAADVPRSHMGLAPLNDDDDPSGFRTVGVTPQR